MKVSCSNHVDSTLLGFGSEHRRPGLAGTRTSEPDRWLGLAQVAFSWFGCGRWPVWDVNVTLQPVIYYTIYSYVASVLMNHTEYEFLKGSDIPKNLRFLLAIRTIGSLTSCRHEFLSCWFASIPTCCYVMPFPSFSIYIYIYIYNIKLYRSCSLSPIIPHFPNSGFTLYIPVFLLISSY